MKKLKIAFCGTPDFSVPTLKTLLNHELVDLVHVISMPDRPAGRGKNLKSPAVIEFAKENNIPFTQTENINKDETLLALLNDLELDAIVVLAFAQFLSSKILNISKLGAFNIHTSLLPKYRGAAPIQYALLNGDTETGVSIQRMVKKMDAGDIAMAVKVPIQDHETGGQLWEKLQIAAANASHEFIQKLAHSEITFTPQDEAGISFAPTITKRDGLIEFKELNYQQIYNKLRAFDPWPGIYFFMDEKRFQLCQIQSGDKDLLPGESFTQDKKLYVGCVDGSVEIISLKPEGKKITTIKEFLNGYRGNLKIG